MLNNWKQSRLALTLFLVGAVSLVSCADRKRVDGAASQSGAIAATWFDFLYGAVKTAGLPPPVAARVYGHAAIALYEAVVPGESSMQSLTGQVHGLGAMPQPTGDIDWPSAANAAVGDTLRGLLTTAKPELLAQLTDLEGSLHQGRAGVVGADIADRSAAHGKLVAAVVLQRAAGDGASAASTCAYTAPTGPDKWVPTPPAFAKPALPCWGQVTPMVMAGPKVCAIPPQAAFSTDKGSPFYGQMYEVYSTVNQLTPEQLAIAKFWADGPGVTGTPPGHWIRLLAFHVRDNGLRLDVAAEAFAKVGIAVNDAFISCWSTKYTYNTPRPLTYVREHIDASWPLTPIVTPNFPDYPSGHSVQSGAAAQVLTGMFGDTPIIDHVHDDDLKLPPRSFASWNAAADEAAISRLYGGIHYRDSIEDGVEHGRCIGREIEARVHFRR